MAKYKTPGIYVEESPFLDSINSIPITAVFIGYTEKHQNLKDENLFHIPTKVSSIQEFESYFGFPQKENNLEITDESTPVSEKISVRFNGSQSLHNLYYSIQSFFDQGKSSCEIISIGNYKNLGESLVLEDFLLGLEILNSNSGNILIAVPENQNLADDHFYLLQQNLLDFCRQNLAFTVLDLPKTSAKKFIKTIESYRVNLQSSSLSFGAAFFPNLVTANAYSYEDEALKIKKNNQEYFLASLKDSDPELCKKYKDYLRQFYVSLPPSAAIVGAFLQSDKLRGIWHAPANIALHKIIKPEISLTSADQELLNVDPLSGKSINAVRNFSEQGILIWGSRTLNGNDTEWRYIPTRRFFSAVQIDIQAYLNEYAVNGDSATVCANISNMVEIYLHNYFNQGAFPGATPTDSYIVNCGLGKTMTLKDVEEGNVILSVLLAPVRSQEFIIMMFLQKSTP
ncbi:phage tail sheath family protein [Kaistella jeonii]|uniref:Phage tail sheath family protein n=1 Tax=Kaistella jeonii TaxID=266749 RepID=A0A0C1F9V3_9FLAO|nr:phage tail sheath family protein [Kaistella jeonii]KIA88658.1 hypothetical protein OA86_09785 [Kaistella jeonii]SFC09431.1 hypothetical protein SAMN05421876_10697 [Kaistella jeonii]VEI95223.1 Phage tail sheath protein [Kaistella jeonii]